ncbi:transmembrane protein 6/97 [Xylariaceae sp. FL0804]|nr:transmembrane protein 6/97 [Xylariaceae sp. FL0804]
MALPASAQRWLDRVYLVYFLIHIPVLFCVDLVPLYPRSLWAVPGAPLSALRELRAYYVATYNDQFFAAPAGAPPPFFVLFALLELALHLPVSLWAVRALLLPLPSGRREQRDHQQQQQLSGRGELLLLVYGVETALTTATCIVEAYAWDPAVVTARQKAVLLGGLYGGYLAVALVLTADMYTRLLARLGSNADEKKKAQ